MDQVHMQHHHGAVAHHQAAHGAMLESQYDPNMPLQFPPPHTIYTFTLSGFDAQFGCPRYSSTVEVSSGPFLPSELEGIFTLQQFKEFVAEGNLILSETHWPVMPCIFTHFCIPFSPFCAVMYCQQQRVERLKGLLATFNQRVLIEKGVYMEINGQWTATRAFCYVIENPTERTKYLNSLAGKAQFTDNVSAPPVVAYAAVQPAESDNLLAKNTISNVHEEEGTLATTAPEEAEMVILR